MAKKRCNRILGLILLILGGGATYFALTSGLFADPVAGLVKLVVGLILLIFGLDKLADCDDIQRNKGENQ